MTTGTVNNIVIGKGYGFIHSDDGSRVFFHYTQLVGLEMDERLQQRRVMFDVVSSAKGLEAHNVRGE